MAEAIPASVSLVLPMLRLKLALPSDSCNVPVPTAPVLPPGTTLETSCWAVASWVTETLYEPLTAVPSAVAVNAEVLLLFAVNELNELGLSRALNADWKVDSALLRVPTEEISVVTVCV